MKLKAHMKSGDSNFQILHSHTTKKGTLYSTSSISNDFAVFEAWRHIDSLVGSVYALPTKDLLIGLDETGKGEVIGHTVLTGVIFLKRFSTKLIY